MNARDSQVLPAATACSKNENVLEGVSCPRCGRDDEFRVVAEVTVNVTDDGSEEADGSIHTWGDESWTLCPECEFEGEWDAFQTGEPKWTAAKEARS